MLSTFPAISDGFFGSQFPGGLIEGGFSPWDCQELLPILLQQQNHEPGFSTTLEPVISGSGSGSDDSNHIQTNIIHMNRKRNSSGSGSDEDERKRRRMISNRESARRSRMRKQTHLQNLRNQVNRLKIGNRDMVNRLHMVIHHSQLVRKENERLQIESVMLQQKLWDMHQLLLLRQLQQSSSAWPCNINVVNHQ